MSRPHPREESSRVVVTAVAAISCVTLLCEIAMTRLISYVLFYPFVYLLIGLALLGLGMGAAWVSLHKDWRWSADRAAAGLTAFAGGIALAMLALAGLPIDLEMTAIEPGILLAWIGLAAALASPFFASGVVLSSAFRAGAIRPGALYAADLGSAALASVTVVALLVTVGPVRALAIAAALALCAALALSRTPARVAACGAISLVLVYFSANHLTAFRPAPGKDMGALWGKKLDTIYSAWHALFRIDVSAEWKVNGLVQRSLWHDGNFGSAFVSVPSAEVAARNWDGHVKQVPFVLQQQPDVLIIGAAGGRDIAVAHHYGAKQVTAVELHPITGHLIRGPYAEFTQHLVDRPGVEYIVSEGRRFVELTDRRFDLVQLVSPDSYAAQPGASQVLVENYLYTREAFLAYWKVLSPGGVIALEIGDEPGRTRQNALRLVAQGRDMLKQAGVVDPRLHLLAVGEDSKLFSVSLVALSRQPFSPQQLGAVRELTQRSALDVLVDPEHPEQDSIAGYLAADGDAGKLGRFGLAELDLHPVSDDRPFFFTYYRWLPLLRGQAFIGMSRGYATGQYLLLLTVILAGIGVLLCWCIPLASAALRPLFSQIWPLAIALPLLGWGFIAVEVNAIQQLTLYLGYPTYALTAVLTGILLGAGMGSAATARAPLERVIPAGTVAVVAMAVATAFALPRLIDATFAQSLPVRALLAALWAGAQGLGLGVFFPSALALLGALEPRLVAWAWALNGAASVFGSGLAVLVAMQFGFRRGALAAACGYVVSGVLLLMVQKRVRPR